MFHNNIQHLIGKTFLSHGEVQHRHFYAHLGREVRSWQLSGHIESEVLAIFDRGVTQFEGPHISFFVNLFSKQGLNNWIKLLGSIFKYDGNTLWNTNLEHLVHLFSFHSWLDRSEIILSLHGFDPNVSLHLRIEHERPPIGVIHDDTVIHSKVLVR